MALAMGDSWEDEDDWEAEADRLVAGVNLHDVDESKFAGEADAPVEDDWENDVPASQVSCLCQCYVAVAS